MAELGPVVLHLASQPCWLDYSAILQSIGAIGEDPLSRHIGVIDRQAIPPPL